MFHISLPASPLICSSDSFKSPHDFVVENDTSWSEPMFSATNDPCANLERLPLWFEWLFKLKFSQLLGSVIELFPPADDFDFTLTGLALSMTTWLHPLCMLAVVTLASSLKYSQLLRGATGWTSVAPLWSEICFSTYGIGTPSENGDLTCFNNLAETLTFCACPVKKLELAVLLAWLLWLTFENKLEFKMSLGVDLLRLSWSPSTSIWNKFGASGLPFLAISSSKVPSCSAVWFLSEVGDNRKLVSISGLITSNSSSCSYDLAADVLLMLFTAASVIDITLSIAECFWQVFDSCQGFQHFSNSESQPQFLYTDFYIPDKYRGK